MWSGKMKSVLLFSCLAAVAGFFWWAVSPTKKDLGDLTTEQLATAKVTKQLLLKAPSGAIIGRKHGYAMLVNPIDRRDEGELLIRFCSRKGLPARVSWDHPVFLSQINSITLPDDPEFPKKAVACVLEITGAQ